MWVALKRVGRLCGNDWWLCLLCLCPATFLTVYYHHALSGFSQEIRRAAIVIFQCLHDNTYISPRTPGHVHMFAPTN